MNIIGVIGLLIVVLSYIMYPEMYNEFFQTIGGLLGDALDQFRDSGKGGGPNKK